jgi:hypothetical protein
VFEKIGRLAEAAATNVSVSRRGFLGRLGQGALVAAGALGGLLGVAAPVQAQGSSQICCVLNHYCQPPAPGCVWTSEFCTSYGFGTCFWNCNGTTMRSSCGKKKK